MGIVLHNGRIETDTVISSENKVYEVLRVIDRTPLFLKEHYSRLVNSLEILKSENTVNPETFKERIEDLIVMLDKDNFNIKVVIDYLNKNDYYFENPSSYPSDEMYKNGVETVTLKYTRPYPNAKVINPELTKTAAEVIKSENVYEAVLLDEKSNVTEGSKSNLFFIQNDILYTPSIEKVLPGITRGQIIETAKNSGITVREINIPSSDLPKYKAAFISGTSPKILPISRIDDIKYDVKDETLHKLLDAFNDVISKDLENYKKNNIK